VIGLVQGAKALGVAGGLEYLPGVINIYRLVDRGVKYHQGSIQATDVLSGLGATQVLDELFLEGEGATGQSDLCGSSLFDLNLLFGEVF